MKNAGNITNFLNSRDPDELKAFIEDTESMAPSTHGQ